MTVFKVNCKSAQFCPFAFTQCIAHYIEDPHISSFFFLHNALHISLWILTQTQRLSIVPVLSHSALCIALRILKQALELQVVFFKLTHIYPLPSAVVLEHQWLPQHKHYFQDCPILKKIQHMYIKHSCGPCNCLSWSTHHSSYMSCRNVLTAILK